MCLSFLNLSVRYDALLWLVCCLCWGWLVCCLCWRWLVCCLCWRCKFSRLPGYSHDTNWKLAYNISSSWLEIKFPLIILSLETAMAWPTDNDVKETTNEQAWASHVRVPLQWILLGLSCVQVKWTAGSLHGRWVTPWKLGQRTRFDVYHTELLNLLIHLSEWRSICLWFQFFFSPPLWSSGQSSWLQIRRPGFDSRHYQKKKLVWKGVHSASWVQLRSYLIET
jgi:hypothetical protein